MIAIDVDVSTRFEFDVDDICDLCSHPGLVSETLQYRFAQRTID